MVPLHEVRREVSLLSGPGGGGRRSRLSAHRYHAGVGSPLRRPGALLQAGRRLPGGAGRPEDSRCWSRSGTTACGPCTDSSSRASTPSSSRPQPTPAALFPAAWCSRWPSRRMGGVAVDLPTFETGAHPRATAAPPAPTSTPGRLLPRRGLYRAAPPWQLLNFSNPSTCRFTTTTTPIRRGKPDHQPPSGPESGDGGETIPMGERLLKGWGTRSHTTSGSRNPITSSALWTGEGDAP